MTHDSDQAKHQIRRILEAINQAWLGGCPDAAANHVHEDMAIVHPGFEHTVRGRDACLASYREFTEQASISAYKESDHVIDVWESTAVATYRFEIAYELNGKAYRDVGRDLFVFACKAGRWQAVWRTLVVE